eukprot:TRINITY_DN2395_c0_g1_i3.p1 TRINITY_DN2395_c0_g1~~TRINITY_DN2395_c0_g1_i3.p1  ORF type:complete len:199 (-),score=-25.66 TRINITY_DN2395_c0_g1_i3:94-690(-)
MCAYPKLIAAYHVLLRLLMPRHSPCALCSLTFCLLIDTNHFVNFIIHSFVYIQVLLISQIIRFLVLVATKLRKCFAFGFILQKIYNNQIQFTCLISLFTKNIFILACCILYTLSMCNFQRTKILKELSLSKLNRYNYFSNNSKQVIYLVYQFIMKSQISVNYIHLLIRHLANQISPQKGGDPAAGSPTATLLRLHPNR